MVFKDWVELFEYEIVDGEFFDDDEYDMNERLYMLVDLQQRFVGEEDYGDFFDWVSDEEDYVSLIKGKGKQRVYDMDG